jgi:hypothetical protein
MISFLTECLNINNILNNRQRIGRPIRCYFFIVLCDVLSKFVIDKMNIMSDSPGENNSYYNDKIQSKIHPDIVFVFGSNLAGRHGKGAALQALIEHEAIYGLGTGLVGNSYAIPTKDHFLRILTLDRIYLYIKQFVRFTQLTNLEFYVTPIGTGLAGYRHEQIAPMFKGVRNCWLPFSWKEFLNENLKVKENGRS